MKQVKIAFAFLLPLMAQTQSLRVGAFPVEVRTFHNRSSGLPSDDVKGGRNGEEAGTALGDGGIYLLPLLHGPLSRFHPGVMPPATFGVQ